MERGKKNAESGSGMKIQAGSILPKLGQNMEAENMRIRRGHRQRAQSLVEFAIMLPLLVLLLVAIIQFGIIIATYMSLNHAALVGARTASVAPAATAVSDGQAAAQKAAQAFIKNSSGLSVNVTSTSGGAARIRRGR